MPDPTQSLQSLYRMLSDLNEEVGQLEKIELSPETQSLLDIKKLLIMDIQRYLESYEHWFPQPSYSRVAAH